MCGRVFQTYNVNQLLRLAGTNLIRNGNRHQVSYNMAPTSYIPAVRHVDNAENNNRELDMMKWGYDAQFQYIINARVEELQEKRTFRPLLNTNRCVIIVEGYFEWNEKKEPFAFKPKSNPNDPEDLPHIYIAALYSNDESIILLTRESTGAVDKVHHRMPVLLDENEIDMWINCKDYKFEKIIDSEILNAKKEKWNSLIYYQLAPYVSSIKEKTNKCLMSIEDYKKELDKNGIKKFFKTVEKKKEVVKEVKTETSDEKVQEELAKNIETQDTSTVCDQEESKQEEKPKKETVLEKGIKHLTETLGNASLNNQSGDFKVSNAYIMAMPDLENAETIGLGKRKSYLGKDDVKNPLEKQPKVDAETRMKKYLYH